MEKINIGKKILFAITFAFLALLLSFSNVEAATVKHILIGTNIEIASSTSYDFGYGPFNLHNNVTFRDLVTKSKIATKPSEHAGKEISAVEGTVMIRGIYPAEGGQPAVGETREFGPYGLDSHISNIWGGTIWDPEKPTVGGAISNVQGVNIYYEIIEGNEIPEPGEDESDNIKILTIEHRMMQDGGYMDVLRGRNFETVELTEENLSKSFMDFAYTQWPNTNPPLKVEASAYGYYEKSSPSTTFVSDKINQAWTLKDLTHSTSGNDPMIDPEVHNLCIVYPEGTIDVEHIMKVYYIEEGGNFQVETAWVKEPTTRQLVTVAKANEMCSNSSTRQQKVDNPDVATIGEHEGYEIEFIKAEWFRTESSDYYNFRLWYLGSASDGVAQGFEWERLPLYEPGSLVLHYRIKDLAQVTAYHYIKDGNWTEEEDWVKEPEVFPKNSEANRIDGTEGASTITPPYATCGAFKGQLITFYKSWSIGKQLFPNGAGNIMILPEYAKSGLVQIEYEIGKQKITVYIVDANDGHVIGTEHTKIDGTVLPYNTGVISGNGQLPIKYTNGIGTPTGDSGGSLIKFQETLNCGGLNYKFVSAYDLRDEVGTCSNKTSFDITENPNPTKTYVAEYECTDLAIYVHYVKAGGEHASINAPECGVPNGASVKETTTIKTTPNTTVNVSVPAIIESGETVNKLVNTCIDETNHGGATTIISVPVNTKIVHVYAEYSSDEIDEPEMREFETIVYRTLTRLDPLASAEIKSDSRNVVNTRTRDMNAALNDSKQKYNVLNASGKVYGIATHENQYVQLLTATRNLFNLTYGEVKGQKIYEMTITKTYPYTWWTPHYIVQDVACGNTGKFSAVTPNTGTSEADGKVDNRWTRDHPAGDVHTRIYYSDDKCDQVYNKTDPIDGRSCKVSSINPTDYGSTHYCYYDSTPDCGFDTHQHSFPSCFTHACDHVCDSSCYYCPGHDEPYQVPETSTTTDSEGNETTTTVMVTKHRTVYCSGWGCIHACSHTCTQGECYEFTCSKYEHAHTGGHTKIGTINNVIDTGYIYDKYGYQTYDIYRVSNSCYHWDKCAGHDDKKCTNDWFYCSAECGGTDRRQMWPPMTTIDYQEECAGDSIQNAQYTLQRTYKYIRQYKYYFVAEYDAYRLTNGTVHNETLPGGSADISMVDYTMKNEYFQPKKFGTADGGRWDAGANKAGRTYHLMKPLTSVSKVHDFTRLDMTTAKRLNTTMNSSTFFKNVNSQVETMRNAKTQAENDLVVRQGSLSGNNIVNGLLSDYNDTKNVDQSMNEGAPLNAANKIWLIGENCTVLRVRNDYLWHDGYIMEMYGRMNGSSETVVQKSDGAGINDVNLSDGTVPQVNSILSRNGYYATNRTKIVAAATPPDETAANYANADKQNIRYDERGINISGQVYGAAYFVSPGSGVGWNTMYTAGLTIPRTIPNDEYDSSFDLVYSTVVNSNIATIRNAGIPKVGGLAPAAEPQIERTFANINSVVVHTPVYIKISMSTAYEDTQIVLGDDAQARLTSFPLEVDKEYVITAKTNGQHRYAKGYGNKEYVEWIVRFADQNRWGIQLSFPFDIYIKRGNEEYEFFKKNTWLQLENGEKTVTFKLPVWTNEGEYLTTKGGSDNPADVPDILKAIVARVVAENDPNPQSQDEVIGRYISNKKVNNSDSKYRESVGGALSATEQQAEYIHYSDISYDFRAYDFLNVNVIGWIYNFRFEYTDDPGYEYMMQNGFKGYEVNQLPFAKKGDNTFNKNYQYALQLGSKFKFSLRTKGTKSSTVQITPQIYYVEKLKTNRPQDYKCIPVDVYFESDGSKFEKITAGSSLQLDTSIFRSGELPALTNADLLDTKLVYDSYHNALSPLEDVYQSGMMFSDFNYTDLVTIGNLGNMQLSESLRLRINRVVEYAEEKIYGLKTPTEIINDAGSKVNFIKSISTWYGEYRLPSSSVAVEKGKSLYDSRGNMQNITKDGYLLICFNIKSLDNEGNEYISYQLPAKESRWLHDGYGTSQNNFLTFLNDKTMPISKLPTTVDTDENDRTGCAVICIYELLVKREDGVVGPN